MTAPPPASNPNNRPQEGGLVQDALLGMKYKYVREQPTTLVVTITPQGKGHPVSRASRPAVKLACVQASEHTEWSVDSRTTTTSLMTRASSSSRPSLTARRLTVSSPSQQKGGGGEREGVEQDEMPAEQHGSSRVHQLTLPVIFDGEGGELLCMSPNLITMHHSISGTHGGQDVYKGSVHSGCKYLNWHAGMRGCVAGTHPLSVPCMLASLPLDTR